MLNAPIARRGVVSEPLEILHAAQEHFPTASARVDLNEEGAITLNLTLSPNFPPVSLNCAVERQSFMEAIKRAKCRALEGGAPNQGDPLGMRRFVLEGKPLSNWQKFRRHLYEASGRRCVDAISQYIQNRENGEQLRQLGLLPTQVAEADLPLFRSYADTLARLPEERTRHAHFARFQELYPDFAEQILTEGNVEQQGDGGRDFYQNALVRLQERVVGQPQATERMATVLASQENGPRNRVFLFVGPTGVGKTELARAVSIFKRDRFVRFEMHGFSSQYDCSRLFGSAAGLVGSVDRPYFAQALQALHPVETGTEGARVNYSVSNAVILFDEFEKAHMNVKQSLLTLFDEGYCEVTYSTNDGRRNVIERYNFDRCLFINTSNLFSREILQAFEQGVDYNQIIELFKELNNLSRDGMQIRPELVARINTIPFGKIPRGECFQRLAGIKFRNFCASLRDELRCREVVIENQPGLQAFLEDRFYGNGTDMRKFERYFEAIRQLIYRNSREIGNFDLKKLIFSPQGEEAATLRIKAFDRTFGCYTRGRSYPLPINEF